MLIMFLGEAHFTLFERVRLVVRARLSFSHIICQIDGKLEKQESRRTYTSDRTIFWRRHVLRGKFLLSALGVRVTRDV